LISGDGFKPAPEMQNKRLLQEQNNNNDNIHSKQKTKHH
jgi:hypothetical protein